MKYLCYNKKNGREGAKSVMNMIGDTKGIIKSKTVCFSGHRPEKLPLCGSSSASVIRVLKSILYKEILDSISDGCSCFITGLARGVDLWAGEIVLELKAQGEDIRLIAVSPYKKHGDSFKGEERFVLGNIMLKADSVIYLGEEYSKGCMQRRNKYMVDNSCRLIAIVSDYKSGTGSTIRYAEKQGVPVRIINAKKLEEQINEIDIENFNMMVSGFLERNKQNG